MAAEAKPAELSTSVTGPRLVTAADKAEVLGDLSKGVYGDDHDYLYAAFTRVCRSLHQGVCV